MAQRRDRRWRIRARHRVQPEQRDHVYAQTDIGGAYRLDPATNRWIPLLDWVGWDSWGWNGVASLASDPVEFDRVYVAAGMYTNSSDPKNGAILRSADYGGAGQQVRDLWKAPSPRAARW